jgi:hypothetical protein
MAGFEDLRIWRRFEELKDLRIGTAECDILMS